MNMINFLGSEQGIETLVLTNKKLPKNTLSFYNPVNAKIFRPSGMSEHSLARYFNYVIFYVSGVWLLLKHRPGTVLYFETLSSWPALIYKKLCDKKIRLMVHYHEYTEPALYASGMFLTRWMHNIEKKIYQKFSWISQTNEVRMQMFKTDNCLSSMDSSVFHILPNYPPKSWVSKKENRISEKQKKLVFVGSLGYKNMYLQELIDWIDKHREEFTLDIYSYNIDAKAKEVLNHVENKSIQFHGGCDYARLPEILKEYDIGVVIYKPFSQNTIHAVSNKVFEYLACGLDVWFSSDMEYTFKFVKQDTFPKVLPVNFSRLDSFDYVAAVSRKGIEYQLGDFFCENVYSEISGFIRSLKSVK